MAGVFSVGGYGMRGILGNGRDKNPHLRTVVDEGPIATPRGAFVGFYTVEGM